MQREAVFSRTCFGAAHRIRAFISASDQTTGNRSQFVVGCGVHNGLQSIDRHVFGFTRCLSVRLPLHHIESRWVCGVVSIPTTDFLSAPRHFFHSPQFFVALRRLPATTVYPACEQRIIQQARKWWHLSTRLAATLCCHVQTAAMCPKSSPDFRVLVAGLDKAWMLPSK